MTLFDLYILGLVCLFLWFVLSLVLIAIAIKMAMGIVNYFIGGEGAKQLKGAAQAAIPNLSIKQMAGVAVMEAAKSGVFQELGSALGQWIKSKIPGGGKPG